MSSNRARETGKGTGRAVLGQAQSAGKPKPRVIVVGVNGMEMDVIRPLILKGDLPNLARVIKNGVHGKLRKDSLAVGREEIVKVV